jgi:peptide/nickel transport system substrate-binding protein
VRDRRPHIWLLATVITLSLVAAACGGKSKSSSGTTQTTVAQAKVKKGGTLTYAADQEPTGFNNNTSKDNGTSVVNVMDRVWPGVFHVNPKFEVVVDKDLMVDEPKIVKEDPQTIEYHINPKATWSDGVPINADDFIYVWTMQKGGAKDIDGKDADVASTTGFEDISSVTGSADGKTVTAVFKNKFSDWKALWSAPAGIVPSHIAKQKGWNDGFDKFDPAVVVSGGPYKIQSYNVGKDLTLVPNDKYWGTMPNLDSIVFRFISDSSQQVPALQNKEVDMIYPQPQLDAVQQVKAIADVNSEINFGLSFEHLDFNFKNEFLADKTVRQAIATGTDRPAIVQRTVAQFDPRAKILNNRQYVTNQPEYKDTSGGKYDKADVAGAKKLLEGAGYTLGADGIYAKAGKKIEMRFSTTSGNKLREDQGVLFQAQMKAIGIQINIDNAPSKEFFGKRLPGGNFDVADFAWIATPFPSSNKAIYSTGSDSNYDNYGNPQVDSMYKQAVAELDEGKRKDLYNQIDTTLWDDLVTIPLYQKPTFIAVRNTFANVGDNASSEGPFWNAELWGLKAD